MPLISFATNHTSREGGTPSVPYTGAYIIRIKLTYMHAHGSWVLIFNFDISTLIAFTGELFAREVDIPGKVDQHLRSRMHAR